MKYSQSILLLCILGTSIAFNAHEGLVKQNFVIDVQQKIENYSIPINSCLDQETVFLIIDYVPKFLQKSSSLFTVKDAIIEAQELISNINPKVYSCILQKFETISIDRNIDISKITQAAIQSYISSHLSTFSHAFNIIFEEFQKGNYKQVKDQLFVIVQKMVQQEKQSPLTSIRESNDQNQDILQQIVNGFYEQNKLADPTTIISCVDADSAAKIVSFAPGFLKKASSIITLPSAISSLQPFIQSLNPQIATCLQGNAEVDELGTVFDITGITEQAAISWATSHLPKITGECSTLNKLWSSGSYNQLGNNASSFAHDVINDMKGRSIKKISMTIEEKLKKKN